MSNYATYSSLMQQQQQREQNDNQNQSHVIHIQSKQHKQEIINNNPFVIICVSASWCGPCKKLAPMYAELCSRFNPTEKVVMCKEDVDMGISRDVTSVPCTRFYINGQLKHDLTINGVDIERCNSQILHISGIGQSN